MYLDSIICTGKLLIKNSEFNIWEYWTFISSVPTRDNIIFLATEALNDVLIIFILLWGNLYNAKNNLLNLFGNFNYPIYINNDKLEVKYSDYSIVNLEGELEKDDFDYYSSL